MGAQKAALNALRGSARWLILVPFVFLMLFGSGQFALFRGVPAVSADTRSSLRADYDPWPFIIIAPVKPEIVEEIRRDHELYPETFGGDEESQGEVSFSVEEPVAAQEPFWSTATPTETATISPAGPTETPVSVAVNSPSATSIDVGEPALTLTPNTTGGATPAAVDTVTGSPAPTSTNPANPTGTPTAANTATSTPTPSPVIATFWFYNNTLPLSYMMYPSKPVGLEQSANSNASFYSTVLSAVQTLQAGTTTVKFYATNTSGSEANISWQLLAEGTSLGGGSFLIPAEISEPVLFSASFSTASFSFSDGDRLKMSVTLGAPLFVYWDGSYSGSSVLIPDVVSGPTPTPTPLATATNTPLATATNTPLATATNTPLATATNTPLATATNTPLATATNTPLPTATNTPLATATNTPLPTNTPTNTPLPTNTPTNTPLPTNTPTNTPLPTNTPTNTPLPTNTPTNTPLPTNTPTNTPLPTATNTPTNTPTPVTVESRVSASSDDAEEKLSASSVNLTSTDIELIYDGEDQTVGLRFLNMTIPQGATITNAYVEFKTDEIQTGVTNLNIYGQAADNPATFTSANDNISSRVKTTAFVQWNNVPAWNTIGQLHQTPNLSSAIQEIVNRAGWASGNAMVIIATGSGTRTAESYDGDAAGAALLHVEYTSVATAGVTVSPTSGLVTSEAGGTATFTVVLNTQPTADVTIALSSSDTTEGTVSPASLTFTNLNWNTAQTVTVTGVDDAVADGNIAYTIVTAAAVSADTDYNGLNPADVSVTNNDDEVVPATWTFEDGTTQSWTHNTSSTATGVANSTSFAHNGTRSLAMSLSSSGGGAHAWHDAPADLTTGKVIEAWVYAPSAGLEATIFIQDQNWTWYEAGSLTAVPAGTWTQLQFTVPGAAVTPLQRLGVKFRPQSGSWTGTVYIDDVDYN